MWCCYNDPQQNLLLIPQQGDENDDVLLFSHRPFSAFKMKFTSWLSHSWRRYLFFILCSPFLVPLLCATCPFLWTLEICYLLCRRRRRRICYLLCRRRRRRPRKAVEDSGGDGLRRCEEGGNEMGLLMHRYLEDQLVLVIGSMYEFGEDDGVDVEYFDCKSPLQQIQEI